MIDRIDLVLGSVRAAELINRYKQRLEVEDLLPERAALAAACHAFADGCIYVIAARGQLWMDTQAEPARWLRIEDVDSAGPEGHTAVCWNTCGELIRMPLDELDGRFTLVEWVDCDP